ncbi:hotdog fold domain-containing protein [Nocardioides massiliensis]|uniref:Acyl-coenzyme A thioesterase PaaI-like protein n=1 Tax=Nocardioides massiliensis TaxID=1325935 RepID=A0ABT9NQI9_9ACTN|nr:hotdog fold domain-containing protein [Nocardioides massiliensis]MDP9822700.1 acyl-coenzyme A thioesterase PaaI-like protein [Nocardioides massiliensis]
MSQIQSVYDALSKVPVLGPHLFSVGFAQKAPYFASIRPHFVALRPNYAAVRIRKRRGVQNHLGTVHAIALCNGLEAAMGAMAEATVPAGKRWIPKGMEVRYTAKADDDVLCIAETDPAQWSGDDPDVGVRVWGVKPDGTVVIEGVIRLWVTRKPSR